MQKKCTITGFPRIGENRELKKALESFWSGKMTFQELEDSAGELKTNHWAEQKKHGIDLIPTNDFSLYDLMLDTSVMLGAIPRRFRTIGDFAERYFAMARGNAEATAMEMTKWFNTNYHYIVPELEADMPFTLDCAKITDEYKLARSLGHDVKINLIGPLTYLSLSKTEDGRSPLSYLDTVMPLYCQVLEKTAEFDSEICIQFDEPVFVKNPENTIIDLIRPVYDRLAAVSDKNKIIVSTYFEHACEAACELGRSTIWGLGLDFIHGRKNLDALASIANKTLVAGVVNGRNIWKNDIDESLQLLEKIAQSIPKERIIVSTSCSLLHVPYSVRNEISCELSGQFSFACEKLDELCLISALFHGEPVSPLMQNAIDANREFFKKRKTDLDGNTKRTATQGICREGNFDERSAIQKKALALPDLPTTTIGSFPQTDELRLCRSRYKKGELARTDYESEIKHYIDECVAFQEKTGLDVLVHGEPERNDMVEYFGELMDGFHFTKNGWVQSYGSRCVKPPVISSDISRPKAITLDWIVYAQSKTRKIMKGMLTGPVTIINWSFVREDIERSEIAMQLAQALRMEIDDLQKAGIKIIQVDEAAFKEGYPLRKENIAEYERWAVESFKHSVGSAWKQTQIHTHMCYSNFDDIIDTIQAMDADVITIETARSGNRLLQVFRRIGYQNEIGPGVYDIHSPRVPAKDELVSEIEKRLEVVDRNKMWINPDCGLKTRKWDEVVPALTNMVAAAQEVRDKQ